MNAHLRLMAGLLICSTLGGISGCIYGGNGRYDERRGDHRYDERYDADLRRFCESGQGRDGRHYDCRGYERDRREYEHRNR